MKINYWIRALALVIAGLAAGAARAADTPPAPLFEENKAQWDAAVRYRALVPGGAVWLRATGFTYDWVSADDLRRQAATPPGAGRARAGVSRPAPAPAPRLHTHAVAVDFVGAAPAVPLRATAPAEAYANYFVGRDARHWATRVRTYAAVTYPQLYPGIDVRVHGSPTGQFEYDVVVAPGGNPAAVRLRYRGATALQLRPDGALAVGTSVGEVREQRPVAWQVGADGQRRAVACRFQLTGSVLSFDLPKGYDPTRELVIDPVVQASTYTGRTALPVGTAYDAAGNMYVGGRGQVAGFFFPATPGAYVVPQALGICVSKFNATGTQLLYSTTLGGTGTGNDCELFRLKTDAAGNLLVAALATDRTTFPMLPTS